METYAEIVRLRAEDDKLGLRFEDQQWTWREVVQEAADRAAAVDVQPYKGPNYFAIRATVTDAINRVETGADDAEASWKKAVEAYQALGLD